MNIHRELFDRAFVLNFEGIQILRPRRRYCAIQYPEAIRDKLKFIQGEAGWGSFLTMQDSVEPQAILQLLPAEMENQFYISLLIPRRELVYGFERPIENSEVRVVMTNLRTSAFHKPDTDGMQFYWKDSPGFYTSNPHLSVCWSRTAWGFQEADRIPRRFPKITEFIAAGQEGFVLWPAPEKEKQKTVIDLESPLWDIPRNLAWAGYFPAVATMSQADALRFSVTGRAWPPPAASPKPKPAPEPAKPLSKHGRLIIWDDEAGIGEVEK